MNRLQDVFPEVAEARISYRRAPVERPSPRRSFSLELGRQLMPKRVSLAGLCEKTTHERRILLPNHLRIKGNKLAVVDGTRFPF